MIVDAVNLIPDLSALHTEKDPKTLTAKTTSCFKMSEKLCQYCDRPQADPDAEMCGDCQVKTRECQEIYGGVIRDAALRQAHQEDVISSTPRDRPNGERPL